MIKKVSGTYSAIANIHCSEVNSFNSFKKKFLPIDLSNSEVIVTTIGVAKTPNAQNDAPIS